MTEQRSRVFGVFESTHQAEAALTDLRDAGFRDEALGWAMPGDTPDIQMRTEEASESATNAATGAISGGLIGALGAAAVSLLIPGVGPIIGGGILATLLGGAALGAAGGSLLGALTALGASEDEAGYYEGQFRSGRPVVTVDALERHEQASGILRQHGGYDFLAQPTGPAEIAHEVTGAPVEQDAREDVVR